jgi:hypothetical protein
MLFIGVGSGRQMVTWAEGQTDIVDPSPGVVVWQGETFKHACIMAS